MQKPSKRPRTGEGFAMVELALHLDPVADTPLYEQLYGALAGQIRTGRLA